MRIMTWNVLNEKKTWWDRVPGIIKAIRAEHPDVICLQEVPNAGFNTIKVALKRSGYDLSGAPEDVDRTDKSYVAWRTIGDHPLYSWGRTYGVMAGIDAAAVILSTSKFVDPNTRYASAYSRIGDSIANDPIGLEDKTHQEVLRTGILTRDGYPVEPFVVCSYHGAWGASAITDRATETSILDECLCELVDPKHRVFFTSNGTIADLRKHRTINDSVNPVADVNMSSVDNTINDMDGDGVFAAIEDNSEANSENSVDTVTTMIPDDVNHPTRLIYLAGDFNAEDSESSMRTLYGTERAVTPTFWTDALRAASVNDDSLASLNTTSLKTGIASRIGLQHGIVHPELLPDRIIDHILVRGWMYGKSGGFKNLHHVEDDSLSDHAALITDII